MRWLGIATFIVGGIFFLILVSQFSQPSFISKGELTATEVFVSILFAFYHIVLGFLCFGIAQILFSLASPLPTTHMDTEKKESPPETLTERRCGQCGENNPGNFAFCSKCGSPLNS